jgi:DNA-binding XRE family transcriptional regulator
MVIPRCKGAMLSNGAGAMPAAATDDPYHRPRRSIAMPDPHPLVVARLLRGLSQADLAELAGLSRESVALIEVGRRSPRIDTMTALADALGVEVADVLPGQLTADRLAALATA